MVESDELEVRDAAFTAAGPTPGARADREAAASVRVYVWNGEAGVDGIGALRLVADPGSEG